LSRQRDFARTTAIGAAFNVFGYATWLRALVAARRA
jgi:hypothetical protein